MNKLMGTLVSLGILAATVASATPRIAGQGLDQSMGVGGNYVLTVNASDFLTYSTTSTYGGTNTISFTNALVGPLSMRFEGWKLVKPFASSTDTNLFNITVTIGDSGTTNRWANGIQVANSQTPTVYASFGANYATNSVNVMDSQTGTVTVITTFNFTDVASSVPANLDRGAIQFYWRIIGKGW